MAITIFLSNTQTLKISGLTDSGGALVGNASLVASLLDSKGVAVGSISALPFVAGSLGTYTVTLPPISITPSSTYTLQITGTANGASLTISLPVLLTPRIE